MFRTNAFIYLLSLVFPAAGWAATDPNHEVMAFLGQHGYYAIGVDNSGTNTEIVQAEVNGRKVSLLIDSGFTRTSLSAACARRLKLDVHDLGFQSNGVGGAVKGDLGMALIASFKLNEIDINRTNTIMVLSKGAATDYDGYLGFDFLHLNAMILPVGGNGLLYKPGTLPVPPLNRYMASLGFQGIPLQHEAGGLTIDGRLNGQPLKAIVDSGAEFSNFDLDYIRTVAGAHTEALRIKGHGVDGRWLDVFGFTPKELSFGALNLQPIQLGAVQAPYFAHMHVNALLGYDLLGTHRAIIDLGHDILWMK